MLEYICSEFLVETVLRCWNRSFTKGSLSIYILYSFGATMREFLLLEYTTSLMSHHR